MKKLIKIISKSEVYIESIGKTLSIEKFNNGATFYCLLDKNGSFNTVDTARTYKGIVERINSWEKLIEDNIIEIK